ncbi:MAG: hypothetical protein QM709_10430 [Spongiibacteraceae bacterium]
MALYRTQSISQDQLLTIAANILDKAFFDSSRVLAKRRYQALEKGNRVFLINLAMEDRSELAVSVRLDSSELQSKLNFSAFRDVLAILLGATAQLLKTKQSVPVFSNGDGDTARWLYLIPAIYRGDVREEIMVLGVDTREPGKLILELLFIDPTQFQAQAANTAG